MKNSSKSMLSVLAMSAILLVGIMCVAPSAGAVDFGNDTSEYANDGECDDPRFTGSGMSSSLDDADIAIDGSDCRRLYNAGMIKLVDEAAGKAATICSAIDFGDNSSEWANDRECDDIRFDGPGTDSIMNPDDLLADANDCRRQCERGRAWLRVVGDE